MARGISTVIGTLLFLVVASLLLALALRAFSETMITFNEVVNNQRAALEQLSIQVNYTRWGKILASDAVSSVSVIQGISLTPLDPLLLNKLDGQAIRVRAQQPSDGGGGTLVDLVKNGEFNEGFNYWDRAPVGWWRIDPVDGDNKARLTATLDGDAEAKASLNQTFTLDFTPTTSTLSFQLFRWNAHPTGQVESFILRVSLLRDNQRVWSREINLGTGGGEIPPRHEDLTGYLTQPGTYKLAFELFMRTKRGAGATFYFWLDKVSLKAGTQPPPGAPGAAYQLSLVISLRSGYTLRGSLYLSSSAPAFLEVYGWERGGWVLKEKMLLEKDVLPVVRLEGGSSFMLLGYSTQDFVLALDYLDLEVLQLSFVTVMVSNIGTEPVDVYAIRLRSPSWERRVELRHILTPGETLYLSFDTYPALNTEHEVRVVTATRVHLVKFTAYLGQ